MGRYPTIGTSTRCQLLTDPLPCRDRRLEVWWLRLCKGGCCPPPTMTRRQTSVDGRTSSGCCTACGTAERGFDQVADTTRSCSRVSRWSHRSVRNVCKDHEGSQLHRKRSMRYASLTIIACLSGRSAVSLTFIHRKAFDKSRSKGDDLNSRPCANY
jgi:hypothetical protein